MPWREERWGPSGLHRHRGGVPWEPPAWEDLELSRGERWGPCHRGAAHREHQGAWELREGPEASGHQVPWALQSLWEQEDGEALPRTVPEGATARLEPERCPVSHMQWSVRWAECREEAGWEQWKAGLQGVAAAH